MVTSREARLWTDGRYFLQAERQLSEAWQLMRTGVDGTPPVLEWLVDSLECGKVVGLDPAVHAASWVVELRTKLESKGCKVVCLEQNPVDKVWGLRRPPLPKAPVRLHPERWAGLSAVDKLRLVRKDMDSEGVAALVVSALDEVAYLFNLRGGDVAHTPVVLAYAIVEAESATLFVDASKLSEEVLQALSATGVGVRPYEEAFEAASMLGDKVWLDPQGTNFALHQAVGPEGPRVTKPSPVATRKARKNVSELEGMRAAHRRDGAAVAMALERLQRIVREGAHITEMDVDAEVTGRRAEQWGYLDNSFDTIAGYGPNGAIIHYRAEPSTAAVVGTSSLLLLDSGAQYVDGTTDITRTMHFGEPSPRERECFTRVLKGHIALATSIFPEGTPGFVVDAFARRPLWEAGLDYRHGTGHGVGAALAVHEGPQRIGQVYGNRTPLEAGMITSNEPGYYADGEFGIRIENLQVVVEKDTPNSFGGKKYLGFEPLTLVPIQRKMIDVSLLGPEEIRYLDAYHSRVRSEIGPLLTGQEAVHAWLLDHTTPLEQPAVSGTLEKVKAPAIL